MTSFLAADWSPSSQDGVGELAEPYGRLAVGYGRVAPVRGRSTVILRSRRLLDSSQH